jgi:hypothetical protein
MIRVLAAGFIAVSFLGAALIFSGATTTEAQSTPS